MYPCLGWGIDGPAAARGLSASHAGRFRGLCAISRGAMDNRAAGSRSRLLAHRPTQSSIAASAAMLLSPACVHDDAGPIASARAALGGPASSATSTRWPFGEPGAGPQAPQRAALGSPDHATDALLLARRRAQSTDWLGARGAQGAQGDISPTQDEL